MQIGIELEYWIVDADGNLASVDGLPADDAIETDLDSSRVVRYLQAFEFRVDSYRPTGIRIDGLDRVSSTQARQLRLHHAERLERDVRELADLERPLPA